MHEANVNDENTGLYGGTDASDGESVSDESGHGCLWTALAGSLPEKE